MELKGHVALVTGAGSGIGQAAAIELARCEVSGLALVDRSDTVNQVVAGINDRAGKPLAHAYIGDVTDADFRRNVYDDIGRKIGVVRALVPAAGITRDSLAVHLDKTTGKAAIYPEDKFRQVYEVNLIAPTYWALEMVARIAENRHQHQLGRWDPKNEHLQGSVVFIGSVSSQGNKGQVAYAATKRGLEGVAATLMKEAMFYGVRCAVIHPGYTDTPMVRALGEKFIEEHILPSTQLKRLIHPDEIANAICFILANSAVSGELWCDAGWHPSA
jgi:NAD(P)-dependent dehydrogenase (short-subunit alcohol dehydrogenase family)